MPNEKAGKRKFNQKQTTKDKMQSGRILLDVQFTSMQEYPPVLRILRGCGFGFYIYVRKSYCLFRKGENKK